LEPLFKIIEVFSLINETIPDVSKDPGGVVAILFYLDIIFVIITKLQYYVFKKGSSRSASIAAALTGLQFVLDFGLRIALGAAFGTDDLWDIVLTLILATSVTTNAQSTRHQTQAAAYYRQFDKEWWKLPVGKRRRKKRAVEMTEEELVVEVQRRLLEGEKHGSKEGLEENVARLLAGKDALAGRVIIDKEDPTKYKRLEHDDELRGLLAARREAFNLAAMCKVEKTRNLVLGDRDIIAVWKDLYYQYYATYYWDKPIYNYRADPVTRIPEKLRLWDGSVLDYFYLKDLHFAFLRIFEEYCPGPRAA